MRKLILLFIAAITFPRAAITEITVGAMAELTGPFSKVGEDCRRGYAVAERVYGLKDSSTRVVFGDNQGEAKAGLSEFQRLVSSEHAAIVVTSRSPVGLAINPVSRQKRIPLVGIVAHPAFTANPYSLRVFPSSLIEGEMLAKQVAAFDKKRIATLTLEDDYFLSLTNKLIEHVGKDKVIFSETILPTETDYSAVMLRMKSRTPDAILLNAGPNQLPALLKWLHNNQVDAKVFSNFLVSSPDVISAAGGAADDVIFVQLDFDKPKFREKLKEVFATEDSSPIGFSCFIGLATILQTIEASKAAPELVTTRLLKVDMIDVLGETIKFIDREAQLSVVPRRIHGAKIQPLR